MHPATRSGDLALIEFEVEIEVLKSVILDRPAGFPQRLKLRQSLHGEAPAQRKTGSRQTQRPLQTIVRQARPGRGLEIAASREHGF